MKNLCLFILCFWGAFTSLSAQIEPNAGNWKTWFISSGQDYRLPAPTSHKEEISQVLALQQQITATQKQQIEFWNAGAPGYRWLNLMASHWMSDAENNGIMANPLLSIAIYDATIAAWNTKYAHNRVRPFQADKRIKLYANRPDSPSFPCEYSVTAGVAVAIFSHFFPNMADSVKRMAQQAMDSRVLAGVAFPSDTKAGFELGKKIAEIEIKQTQAYLNKTPWDGKIPNKPGLWSGKYAMMANAGKSKTIVLDSSSQFRPGPPPDFAKDMEELRNHKPNFNSIANAFYHASQSFWDDALHKKIFEHNLHLNPPKAAKLYAITAIGFYDGFIACWDAKYAYWGIRPNQYDPNFKPVLIHTPPFPGYPSGHAALSSVHAELYAYFFPAESSYFREKAKEVGESRFQGGIHFRTDNEVALELGKKVANAIIQKVKGNEAAESNLISKKK
jgi:hypothetical protein